MNLLLTGSFPIKNNELIAEYINELGNNLEILYVGYSDNSRKFCNRVKQYGFTKVDYLNINREFNKNKLDQYDVIMTHGGSPFKIKENMIKSGFDKFLLTAKSLIVTTSGSSLVLSNNFEIIRILYPKMKGDDSKGLQIFPYNTIPHYQRYSKKIDEIENYSKGKHVYAIPDGSAIAYNGKTIELLGEAKRISN